MDNNTKYIKKFLIKTSVFVSFALVFYILVLPIWSSIFPPFLAKNVRNCMGCYGHFFTRNQDAKQVKNPDILFLGSSHSYRGLDPRVFAKHGYKSFNLGSSSQSPINTQVLIKQYVDKIQPKLVILEVYAGTIGADGVESSLDITSNGDIDINSFDMAMKINHLTTYNTLIFSYLRGKVGLNNNFKESIKQDRDTYIKHTGFVESSFQKNPMLEEKTRPWHINPKQWKALEENTQFLKQRKIPYLLIQAPITQKLYEARTNNQEIDEKLAALGPYKNFYGSLKLNDTMDFYDSNHLNQDAVVKFNEVLIKYLKNHPPK